MTFEKFWEKHGAWIIAVVASVLALGFVGSVLGVVFGGGDEFKTKYEYVEAKGMITVENDCYSDRYLSGDTFAFDKDSARVRLLAKDPAIEEIINITNLPKSEYGFLVNGEGEYIDDPSTIVMTKDIEKITLVSKAYKNLKTDLPMTVIGGHINNDVLVNSLLIEAENTNIYGTNGKLLTDDDKRTLPTAEKPYLSNVGTDIKGENCSGGACIRNFAKGMKYEFEFVCAERAEINLEIFICKRPADKGGDEFDTAFATKLNGKTVKTNAIIPLGPNGNYFDPYSFTVTVVLQRGLNVLTFEHGGADYVFNFDAIRLTSVGDESKLLFGDKSAVIYDEADSGEQDNTETDTEE